MKSDADFRLRSEGKRISLHHGNSGSAAKEVCPCSPQGQDVALGSQYSLRTSRLAEYVHEPKMPPINQTVVVGSRMPCLTRTWFPSF
jgi:hypothetical protein